MEDKMNEQGIRLPDTSKLIISSSPHAHKAISVRMVMLLVILALLPALGVGIYRFGMKALSVVLVCCVSCVAVETIANAMMGRKNTAGDFSAALTGVLLGMNLPPGTPIWVCIIGSVIAIGLGKMVYGGLGYNPFNPALVGRVALLIAVPVIMTKFMPPCCGGEAAQAMTHVTSQATPLGYSWAEAGNNAATWTQAVVGNISYSDMFWGRTAGSLGEISFIALLIGGLFLIACGLIRWQIPVFYIGTVAIVTGVAHAVAPGTYAPAQFHVLSGGLALGAFFMATDMVTSPITRSGAVVFGIGCGVLTSIIRLWGSYPEGVSFSILIMNALTPLIDKLTAGKPFGMRKGPQEVRK